MDNHLPGCAALRCTFVVSTGRTCIASKNAHQWQGHEFEPGCCDCELGRLRAEVERLQWIAENQESKYLDCAKAYTALREWQRRALDVIKRCGESEFLEGDEFADLTRKLIAEAGQTEGEG